MVSSQTILLSLLLLFLLDGSKKPKILTKYHRFSPSGRLEVGGNYDLFPTALFKDLNNNLPE